jgi:hypothetical protein
MARSLVDREEMDLLLKTARHDQGMVGHEFGIKDGGGLAVTLSLWNQDRRRHLRHLQQMTAGRRRWARRGAGVRKLLAKRGRGAAFVDGRVLHVRWFGVVLRRLNIARHRHSTGLAAIGRLGGGWGVENAGRGLGGRGARGRRPSRGLGSVGWSPCPPFTLSPIGRWTGRVKG